MKVVTNAILKALEAESSRGSSRGTRSTRLKYFAKRLTRYLIVPSATDFGQSFSASYVNQSLRVSS